MALLRKDFSWKDVHITVPWVLVTVVGILLCFAREASGTYSCKETRKLFNEVKEKLDTALPIEYSPVFYALGIILPIVFIIKTIRDWMVHRRAVRYIDRWDAVHLGPRGQKNELIKDYPFR